jgi:succinate dehydrogenase / fumarate reductase cytochrome b subunit
MQGVVIPILYAVGLAACVFHLANGIWTMGITWGVWTSPGAQMRAGVACAAIGVGLTVLSAGAFVGAITIDIDAAATIEDKMYESKVSSGEIKAHDGEKAHESEPVSVSAIDAAKVDR